jgi:hypothetical protein
MSASAADTEQWAPIGGEWERVRRVPANLAPHDGVKCPRLGRGKPSWAESKELGPSEFSFYFPFLFPFLFSIFYFLFDFQLLNSNPI